MSQQAISVLDLPLQASGAVQEYRCVGFNGAQATVAGQKIHGVARRGAANGQWFESTVLGTAVAEAGGAFGAGVALVTDANGRVIAATALGATVGTLAVAAGATAVTSAVANGAGSVTGTPALAGSDLPQHIIGFSLQAATGAGDFVEILVR
ncbi:capsid cement protein [Chitinibacter sp. ZOR0017]|uniref:capsid cement protein n=1 Tax=Chitinibacter sp. ZOR0017 TaxID=1339254 RepID=UPI0006470DDE|nr:capsid cement protein [Chitinibacter sp. ZOR0017]